MYGGNGSRLAILEVSIPLLEAVGIVDFDVLQTDQAARDKASKALSLPPETRLLAARWDAIGMGVDQMTFRAEHPRFPESRNGFALPMARAIFRSEGDTARFVDWELH